MNFDQPKNEITKTPENKIKEGVDFVFEQNPELSKIGTEQQYSKYLETIFPDSKIKDIVYHGSPDKNIESMLSPKDEGYKKQKTTTTGVAGIYFTDKIDEAKKYIGGFNGEENSSNEGKVYPVILNITKPIIVANTVLDGLSDGFGKTFIWNVQEGSLDGLKKAGIDGMIAGEYMIRTEGHKELVVFNKEDAHILGSNQDIEKFKEFVSKEK